MRQSDRIAIFKLIPPKVAVSVLIVAILYALLQPAISKSLGWPLPSIASIFELDLGSNPNTKSSIPRTNEDQTHTSSNDNVNDSSSQGTKPSRQSRSAPSERTSESRHSSDEKPIHKSATESQDPKLVHQDDTEQESEQALKYGVLQSIGRDRFKSPAGLVYGPGSEQGHRLKHIELHLSDNPNRPGSHGVFDGDMKAFLLAIDDAYNRASAGAKGTNRRAEDDAVVYEASFSKPIGYLGGLEGKRKRKPELKRLRVVVSNRNDSVITAFPY